MYFIISKRHERYVPISDTKRKNRNYSMNKKSLFHKITYESSLSSNEQDGMIIMQDHPLLDCTTVTTPSYIVST